MQIRVTYESRLCCILSVLPSRYGLLLAGPGLSREKSYTRMAVNKRRAGEFFAKAAKLAPFRYEFHCNHAGTTLSPSVGPRHAPAELGLAHSQ